MWMQGAYSTSVLGMNRGYLHFFRFTISAASMKRFYKRSVCSIHCNDIIMQTDFQNVKYVIKRALWIIRRISCTLILSRNREILLRSASNIVLSGFAVVQDPKYFPRRLDSVPSSNSKLRLPTYFIQFFLLHKMLESRSGQGVTV